MIVKEHIVPLVLDILDPYADYLALFRVEACCFNVYYTIFHFNHLIDVNTLIVTYLTDNFISVTILIITMPMQKLRRIGNSLGIIIPKDFLKSMNLTENDTVEIDLKKDKIDLTLRKK